MAGRFFTIELPEKPEYFLLTGNPQGPEVTRMNKNKSKKKKHKKTKKTLLSLSIYSRKGETMNRINTIITAEKISRVRGVQF